MASDGCSSSGCRCLFVVIALIIIFCIWIFGGLWGDGIGAFIVITSGIAFLIFGVYKFFEWVFTR
jgi:hypothetical protein